MTLATKLIALKLHSLPEADREWVLERLNSNISAVIRSMVTELESLGITKDHTTSSLIDSRFAEMQLKLNSKRSHIFSQQNLDKVDMILEQEPNFIRIAFDLINDNQHNFLNSKVVGTKETLKNNTLKSLVRALERKLDENNDGNAIPEIFPDLSVESTPKTLVTRYFENLFR